MILFKFQLKYLSTELCNDVFKYQ